MGTEGVWLQLTQSLDASSSLQAPPLLPLLRILGVLNPESLAGICVQIMWPLSLPCSGLGASFVVPPNGRPLIHLLSSFLFMVAGFLFALFCFFCCWLFYSCCPSGFISFFKKKSFLPLMLVSFGMLIKCMCSIFHF